MTIIETITSRRSIRRFKKEYITNEELHAILDAGNMAPSGNNKQPWHFTVIKNSELINTLNVDGKKCCVEVPIPFVQKVGLNPRFNMFYGAPQIIVVSKLNDSVTPEQDCAAATQNILLAAESLNIGSCWVGYIGIGFSTPWFMEKYRTLLKLPENATPLYVIALGYKNMTYKKPIFRRDSGFFDIIS
jgi:nitroreductase